MLLFAFVPRRAFFARACQHRQLLKSQPIRSIFENRGEEKHNRACQELSGGALRKPHSQVESSASEPLPTVAVMPPSSDSNLRRLGSPTGSSCAPLNVITLASWRVLLRKNLCPLPLFSAPFSSSSLMEQGSLNTPKRTVLQPSHPRAIPEAKGKAEPLSPPPLFSCPYPKSPYPPSKRFSAQMPLTARAGASRAPKKLVSTVFGSSAHYNIQLRRGRQALASVNCLKKQNSRLSIL